jgi:hypothetical protein
VGRPVFLRKTARGLKNSETGEWTVAITGTEMREEIHKSSRGLVLHLSQLDFALQRIGAGPVSTLLAGR